VWAWVSVGQAENDTFKDAYILGPCLVLAIFLHPSVTDRYAPRQVSPCERAWVPGKSSLCLTSCQQSIPSAWSSYLSSRWFVNVLWAFSTYLEAVALLPQALVLSFAPLHISLPLSV
jgi:hypothetical protein